MVQGSIPCRGKRILPSPKCRDLLSGPPSLLWKIDAGVTGGFEFRWPFNAIWIKAKKEWSFASAPYTFMVWTWTTCCLSNVNVSFQRTVPMRIVQFQQWVCLCNGGSECAAGNFAFTALSHAVRRKRVCFDLESTDVLCVHKCNAVGWRIVLAELDMRWSVDIWNWDIIRNSCT